MEDPEGAGPRGWGTPGVGNPGGGQGSRFCHRAESRIRDNPIQPTALRRYHDYLKIVSHLHCPCLR